MDGSGSPCVIAGFEKDFVVKFRRKKLSQRSPGLWLAGLLIMGLASGTVGSSSRAGELGSQAAAMNDGNWKWWHSIFYRKDGHPRYPSGAGSLSRQHQKRLVPHPPYCPPEYGYHQPCWRQLPVTPRCVTCETVQSDYAVPMDAVVPPLPPPAPVPALPVPSIDPVVPDPAPVIKPPAPELPRTTSIQKVEPKKGDAETWAPAGSPTTDKKTAAAAKPAKAAPVKIRQQLAVQARAVEPSEAAPEKKVAQAVYAPPSPPVVPAAVPSDASAKTTPTEPRTAPKSPSAVDSLYRLSDGPVGADEADSWLIRFKSTNAKLPSENEPVRVTTKDLPKVEPAPAPATPVSAPRVPNVDSDDDEFGVWRAANGRK